MDKPGDVRILYMEDDLGLARLVQKRMKRAGYSVDIANDGKIGLEMYQTGKYDIIAVDQQMPGYSGIDVIKILASHGPLPPIVMITGRGNELVAVEAMKYGAGDYVVKDVEGKYFETLPGVIERLLERQRLIEEKKAAEEALRQSERQLKESQKIARLGQWELDTATMKVTGSDELLSIFGLSHDEATLESFIEVVHPDDREYDVSHIRGGMEHGEPWDIEHRLILRDGTQKWIHAIGEAIKDENGKIISLTGITQDITERKQWENDLKKAKEAAERANQAKSTFLANVSHELRTPLNAILGFSQLLSRDANLEPEQQEHLRIIRSSGEHLLNLINEVLDMSKIESGRMVLNEQSVDLYRLMDDVENMFCLKAKEQGLDLAFEVDAGVPRYIRTDGSKLQQVLVNLLGNALKFTKKGGISVRVRQLPVENREAKKTDLQFEVEDTGEGIAPDELDSLFTAFAQTGTGRKSQEGTGLGLPISRKFAQMMGTDMIVESEVGKGSVFRFGIQAEVMEGAEPEAARPERCVVALEPDQPCYRILIVDDRESNRLLLLKLLTLPGFEVREAENGKDAVDIWREWEPHLILMDMRMPVMDGYEATKRIKNTTKGRATAIIAVTASVFKKEWSVVLSAGCDDFVRKPFTESQIFDVIHRHLGVRFIYEKPSQAEAADMRDQERDTLIVDALAALPADWVADLKQSIMNIDLDRTSDLIGQISTRDTILADTLGKYVDDFKYERILMLIQEAAS